MRLHLSLLLPFLLACDGLAQSRAPKIWDDKALEDWATPIAALGVRPGHFSAAEYYAVPAENLKTYPVYHPDREPPGYWEWLQRQRPQPLVDTSALRTREDWVKAGRAVFQTMDDPVFRTADPVKIRAARDSKSYDRIHTLPDGSLFMMRWVVTNTGLQLGITACSSCHGRVLPDGRVLWGVAQARPPNARAYNPVVMLPSDSPLFAFRGDSRAVEIWRRFTVPWAPDERVERIRTLDDVEARNTIRPDRPDVFARVHGSPWYMTKIPDLNGLHYSRYMDATGTHRLRGPEDIARYAALVSGSDPMQFSSHHILSADQRRVSYRFADEVLYALGVYLFSLEPPKNPDPAPEALISRGRDVFTRETCVRCHVPPNYTSGKLTLAQAYTPPVDHPNRADILNISVGTDPGLALKTRKGTGFYKIPSLRGVWYRPLLLHDGSVASLEEMFDPDRLKPDHVPGGWKGPGVTKRAIPGHSFGLNLNPADKTALLAFLRSL